jgi:hypothetical protein
MPKGLIWAAWCFPTTCQAAQIQNYNISQQMAITEDDIAAARAYTGALLEFTVPTYSGEATRSFFIDREWYTELVRSKVPLIKKAIAEWEEQLKSKPAMGKATKPVAGGDDASTEPESKEDKAKRLEKERKNRWKAVQFNHDVWASAIKNVGTIKPMAPEALNLWLNHRVNWDALDKAMVLLDPKHLENTDDAARPKYVTFEKGNGHGLAENTFVSKGKTVEEKLQRVIALIAATLIIDTEVISQARRPQYTMYPVKAADIKKLVGKVFTQAQLKKIRG